MSVQTAPMVATPPQSPDRGAVPSFASVLPASRDRLCEGGVHVGLHPGRREEVTSRALGQPDLPTLLEQASGADLRPKLRAKEKVEGVNASLTG